MTTTKPREQVNDPEYYQVEAARQAIAREIARMIGKPSPEVMAAKVAADEALSQYRDAVRNAARSVLELM